MATKDELCTLQIAKDNRVQIPGGLVSHGGQQSEGGLKCLDVDVPNGLSSPHKFTIAKKSIFSCTDNGDKR